MKSIAATLVMVCVAFFAFGDDTVAPRKDGTDDDYIKAEVRKIMAEEADTAVSDLTLGEIDQLMSRLSIPIQKEAYIEKSATASWMLPGKGQFMNDDTLSGVLFMTADIIAATGTLVGSYFLLPKELRFSNLDYFNTSFAEIKTTWVGAFESSTLMETLPLIGVMAGGMTLHHIIAVFSAKHAGKLAQERIDKGIVTFEPITTFPGHPHFGFGAKMRF